MLKLLLMKFRQLINSMRKKKEIKGEGEGGKGEEKAVISWSKKKSSQLVKVLLKQKYMHREKARGTLTYQKCVKSI